MPKLNTITLYTLEGTCGDDSHLYATREQYQQIMEEMLREKGYVPVHNLRVRWTLNWNSETDTYDFEIAMYGIYVGKREAKKIKLWDGELDEFYYEVQRDSDFEDSDADWRERPVGD
jgi:hypothetical protein